MVPEKYDLKTFLRASAKEVDEELDRLLPPAHEEPYVLHEAIRHSIFAGGKRFRPALVFAVGEALGADRARLVTYAAAVEMIHTYSLIHDDLPAMDDDNLRRGVPTCHVKFGEATAILAGDVLQALAFKIVAADERLSSETRVRLITDLAVAAGTPTGMAAGQQMDLSSEGIEISAELLKEIHQKKTGAMIAASARAGAVIARTDKATQDKVAKFAEMLGLLYQITDDLLDVTQTTDVLGKTAGKDESVEKATYPSIYGIEKSRELAGDVYSQAIKELELINNSELLKSIADYVLHRTF
ncbi:MAG: polyprenyl synthetase family protein [Pyrinomonadaceae bacterium]|nr:polyprenyl synthetase family protein [Pyrinomonadaceae bacterium]